MEQYSEINRLAVFATHPIQYQVSVWRELAAAHNLDIVVHYFSDHSIRGGMDPGFGLRVAWDIDLLAGYKSVFLDRRADLAHQSGVRIPDARSVLCQGAFDWVFISGYTHGFERQIVWLKTLSSYRIVMRGEFSDERAKSQIGGGGRGLRLLARDAYLRWFYNHVDSFGVIGTAAKCHLERLGVPGGRLFSSPYNVDSDLFEKQVQYFRREACRRELGIPDDRMVVLFSGKLISRKAPMLLAEAVMQIPEREQVLTIFVGEGELRTRIEERFRPIMGERLLMTGFVNQSQLGRYLAAADVFVLPSEFETWGLVVNEAMHFGLPVIVSDGVGCRHDLVAQGKTGLIFRSGDVHGLSEAIRAFLRMPSLARSMGQSARTRIRNFSTVKAAAGIMEAISGSGS